MIRVSMASGLGWRSATRLPQQAKELVAVDPGVGENAAQRPALEVPGVHRNGDDVPVCRRWVKWWWLPLERASFQPFCSRTRTSCRGRPTEVARSRGDGDPLDLRRQGQRAPLPLQHLEISLDRVLGHLQRFIAGLPLRVAARQRGTEILKPPSSSGGRKTSNS